MWEGRVVSCRTLYFQRGKKDVLRVEHRENKSSVCHPEMLTIHVLVVSFSTVCTCVCVGVCVLFCKLLLCLGRVYFESQVI